MHLEKIEIQGFKSFAGKNVLRFPGLADKKKYGITAVVGPNGSGKSNIADAVRWVLGEQSLKQLRGKKSEDVIFSGSDKKGKLGMAEVSLFLDNQDKKAPIDYSEVVLTRRLYRDGDSEYLINNSRVRLSDIQMLLARSGVGQKTYSVIGQGMVEGFLNTTLSERKEFFDEATGVKQFQIKRDDALNKLRSSYENLEQVNMLLSEIEPRMKSLSRQVEKLAKREDLEGRLRDLQLKYYRNIWHEINDKFGDFSKKFLEIEKNKTEKDKKLEKLNSHLEDLENDKGAREKKEKIKKALVDLRLQKENISSRIASIRAKTEVKLESEGNFDLAWLENKKSSIEKELENLGQKKEILNKKIKNLFAGKDEQEKKVADINFKIRQLNEETSKIARQKPVEEIKFDREIEGYLKDLEDAEASDDLDEIKNLIKKISKKIKTLLSKHRGEDMDEERKEFSRVQREISLAIEERQKVFANADKINSEISAVSAEVDFLKSKEAEAKAEKEKIAQKIKENSKKVDYSELEKEKQDLEAELEKIEKQRSELAHRETELDESDAQERRKFFSLQKDIQNMQAESNRLAGELSEARANSARFETRLEDLEAEIRENLGSLAEVKKQRAENYIGIDEAPAKIKNYKRQLEQIGGIDAEAKEEYEKTKERFDFLSGQSSDLTEAADSLREVIKELDINIKEKFDKEFATIAKKFEEYFKILFNGGVAKIIKITEEEEKDDGSQEEDFTKKQDKRLKFLKKHNATGLSGIEVQATPPGKKIKSVSVLSGGERALTAIALICAIISANPSPFVVLDEVDAALDEANSERLARILEDLSNKTQFIAITHNRASMRVAEILYGVTMGDDGVSKLLSVKLEDIKKR